MNPEIPKGLIFSKNRKKRSLIAVAILAAIQLCLIWPIFPIFASPEPLILNFPMPFAWAIFMVICSFITLFVYFKFDEKEGH